MRADHLTAEIVDSVRAHYITGHFDRETAVARIQHAGFEDRTEAEAGALLDTPMSLGLVLVYAGRAVCEHCEGMPAAELACCSSHNKKLCHACYRRTHFVEVCGCADDEREAAVAGLVIR